MTDPATVGFVGLLLKDLMGSTIESMRITPLIDKIAKADPRNVQEIAASQIGLLNKYHEAVLLQAQRSFYWAIIGAGIGLVFFVIAAGYSIFTGNVATAIIPVIAGAVVETVAGLIFSLYGRTTAQLSDFHLRLEILQRHLLANSICESLNGDTKEQTRAELVREIAQTLGRPSSTSSVEPTRKNI